MVTLLFLKVPKIRIISFTDFIIASPKIIIKKIGATAPCGHAHRKIMKNLLSQETSKGALQAETAFAVRLDVAFGESEMACYFTGTCISVRHSASSSLFHAPSI